MRTLARVRWCHRLAGAIDDRFHARPIIDLLRDNDVEIIRQPDQPPIEYLVRRA